MLSTRLLYFILIREIITGGVLSTDQDPVKDQFNIEDEFHGLFPLKQEYFTLIKIVENQIGCYYELVNSRGASFFYNSTDYSINRFYQYLISYYENVFRFYNDYKEITFPFDDYERFITSGLDVKKILAPFLYKKLCDIDRVFDLLGFAIKLGKYDITELIVNLKGSEMEYLNKHKELPVKLSKFNFIRATRYQKVKEEFFKDLAKFMNKDQLSSESKVPFGIKINLEL